MESAFNEGSRYNILFDHEDNEANIDANNDVALNEFPFSSQPLYRQKDILKSSSTNWGVKETNQHTESSKKNSMKGDRPKHGFKKVAQEYRIKNVENSLKMDPPTMVLNIPNEE